MVNVSKKELDKKTAEKIHAHLLRTITKLKQPQGIHLLEELLTPSEQIMLAKRLAALFLLAENIPPYRVSRLLKLSSSTAAQFAQEIEEGKHKNITRVVRKKQDRDTFLASLETVLRAGMPERGKNRWKWLDELYPK